MWWVYACQAIGETWLVAVLVSKQDQKCFWDGGNQENIMDEEYHGRGLVLDSRLVVPTSSAHAQ